MSGGPGGGIGLGAALRSHFGGRQDAFTSALVIFPLFLVYQLGILTGAPGRNGADFVTTALIRLCDQDFETYLLLLAAMSTVYVATLAWLRRRGSVRARLFLPMLLESSVYAFFMGGVIQLIIVRFDQLVPILAIGDPGLLGILTISAGAGFHEELVFRAGLLAGLIRLFSLPAIPFGRLAGGFVALVVSSMIFSAVHHLGPGAEPFTMVAFVYRSLAGLIFGFIYLYRGLGVAVWSHALYDVFVLALR